MKIRAIFQKSYVTDRPTDRPTDTAASRVAFTRLKKKKKRKTWIKKREPMKNTADSLIDRTKNLWGPEKKRAKEKKMNKLHQ